MRIMGLDVGSKTVGVAISDPLGFTAQGLEIIQINEDKGEFGLDRLAELVKEYKVDRFVVGLPKNMNNTSGPRVEASQAYGKRIEDLFGLPVAIKPIDEELVVASATKTKKVVTVEEHSVIGGLGSAVAEVLCEKAPTKMMRIGVNDRFGESGPAVELIHKYELDAEGIYKKVKAFAK